MENRTNHQFIMQLNDLAFPAATSCTSQCSFSAGFIIPHCDYTPIDPFPIQGLADLSVAYLLTFHIVNTNSPGRSRGPGVLADPCITLSSTERFTMPSRNKSSSAIMRSLADNSLSDKGCESTQLRPLTSIRGQEASSLNIGSINVSSSTPISMGQNEAVLSLTLSFVIPVGLP